jgi:cell division protein FtsL
MKQRRKTALKAKNVILSIAICTAVCLAGVGYIWAKSQLYGLGREIKRLETKLDELKRTNALMHQAYAAMSSPRELDAAVRRLNLGLAAPRPDQIVRMREPVPQRETNYAANDR